MLLRRAPREVYRVYREEDFLTHAVAEEDTAPIPAVRTLRRNARKAGSPGSERRLVRNVAAAVLVGAVVATVVLIATARPRPARAPRRARTASARPILRRLPARASAPAVAPPGTRRRPVARSRAVARRGRLAVRPTARAPRPSTPASPPATGASAPELPVRAIPTAPVHREFGFER